MVSGTLVSVAALGEEGGWRGYMMPKGVDPAMKEAIVKAFSEAIANEDHLKEMEGLGLIPAYMEGQEYIDFLKSQEADVTALKPELGWN